MKTLLLMRHAKSDRSAGTLDFDRPLNKRGRRAAPEMAAVLREEELIPDLAIVSSSARTRETWELMADAFGGDVSVEYLRELYLAPPETIFQLIKSVPRRSTTLLVLGHNPGIQTAVRLLASVQQDASGQAALAAAEEKFPTAAIARLDLPDQPWADTRYSSARMCWMRRPARA